MSEAAANTIFEALGDGTRRAIVERLSHGPLSVSQLADPLGVTVSAVGQHLRVLEQSGMVSTDKMGRTRTCRLEPAGLAAAERWIAHCRSNWERRLDRLGDVLDED